MTDLMTKPTKVLTDEHRAAMSLGSIQANAVRTYLTSIQSAEPVRRPTKSAAELQELLANSTDPMERLRLRPQLREALEMESKTSSSLTAKFIEHAAAFGARFGITYADWREEGVPASVLKKAGIGRSK